MPYISVESGALSDAQKAELILRLTQTASEVMRVPPGILYRHDQGTARPEFRHRRQDHRQGKGGVYPEAPINLNEKRDRVRGPVSFSLFELPLPCGNLSAHNFLPSAG